MDDHIIVFHDKSRRKVSQRIAEEVMIKSCDQNLQAIKINGVLYKFSSISKIMRIEQFYIEYPDERPVEVRNQFEDIYGAGGNQQIRHATGKAKELMEKGFVEARIQGNEMKETAKQKFQNFISGVPAQNNLNHTLSV